MKRVLFACAFALLGATSSVAQQADAGTMQRAINVLVAQRNAAMDQAAQAQMQAQALSDEVSRLKAELEAKKPDPPK